MAANLPVTDGGFIPGDVMVDILARISARSLVRLRSVCKSWSNLIIHPQFAANHLNRRGNQQQLILFPGFTRNYKCKFVSFFRLNQCEPFTTLFEIIPKSRRKPHFTKIINFPDFFKEMVVAGSVNGIICLSTYYTSYTLFLVLWNPAINMWKPIPFPRPRGAHRYSSLGLGFDSLTNDYRVIMVVAVAEFQGSRIQLYSANQDAWVEVNQGAIIPFGTENPNCSVIVNGVPYWTSTNKRTIHRDCEEVIAAFDPHTGFYKPIRYPVHVQNDKTSVHLMNLMDSLAVVIYSPGQNPNNIVDVYALDDTHGTWIKKFSTSLDHMPIQDNISIQQCFEEEAGEVVLVCRPGDDDRSTFFYDPKTNRVLHNVARVGIDACLPLWDESYRHIESLVCITGMELRHDDNEEDARRRTATNHYIGRPLGRP